jgi:hypothetical protein
MPEVIAMRTRSCWLVLALLVLGAAVSGAQAAPQGATVDYVDGSASQGVKGSWVSLTIGEALPADALVKLEDHSLLQLKTAGTTITLVQPGTYAVKDLLTTRASLRAAGAGTAVAAAFSKILRGTGRSAGTAGGVRAETMERQAPAEAPTDSGTELLDDLAGTYARDGDARSALGSLAAIAPTGAEPWANDYVLLKARLLEDAFAFSPAIDLLLAHGAQLASDQSRAQTWLFLLALGYKGTGDAVREQACLDKVISMEPETGLAAAAALLQANP